MFFCRVEPICRKNVATALITTKTNIKSDTPLFNYLHETCGKSFSTISWITARKVSKYGPEITPYLDSFHALDISNFCENANTQPLTEFEISRIENAP